MSNFFTKKKEKKNGLWCVRFKNWKGECDCWEWMCVDTF